VEARSLSKQELALDRLTSPPLPEASSASRARLQEHLKPLENSAAPLDFAVGYATFRLRSDLMREFQKK
jgi:hypothetical protein